MPPAAPQLALASHLPTADEPAAAFSASAITNLNVNHSTPERYTHRLLNGHTTSVNCETPDT